MGQASTIKDFLVALGFKTDNVGLSQMQGAMKGVELNAKALNAALGALATAAVVAVRQTASELDKLYFSSQRIGASAGNINAFGNAISQMGGSAEGAVNTLETLAEKMRNSPGYEGMLNSLGVGTKDANGNARDRVEIMKDLSGVLSKMPAYQANAYASSLGIDQNTLLAMRDGKFISNMEKYQKLQKEMGMNDDLTKSGNEFMSEYRDLTMITKTGLQVIIMQAGKALIPVLRLLNQMLQAGIHAFSQLNPHVKEGLAVGLRFALLSVIFGTFFKTFGLLFKFIPMLKSFIGLLKLMRLAFLASPIGIILALAAALYLLYDDYKTWKDGGRSLFDWSKWTNGIDKIISKIKDFLSILEKVKDKVIQFIHKVVDDPVEAVKDVAQAAKEAVKSTTESVADSTADTALKITSGLPPVMDKIKKAAKDSAVVAVGAGRAVVHSVQGLASVHSQSSYSQKYSSKNFTAEKAKAIQEVANRIGVDPNDLAAVISFETGGTFSPSIKNPKSSATGLIQFMGKGATKSGGYNNGSYYGMSRSKFSKLSFTEQMRYVEKYFKDRGFKAGSKKNVGDVYGAVTGYGYKRGSEAYEKNKVWDSNGNGVIEKGEMVKNPSFRKHQRKYFSGDGKPATGSQALANFAQHAQTPDPRTYTPPKNPHRSQINSSRSSSSNVTIHQEYNTTMTINGAREPVESANAVQRNQDNANAIMARSAQNIMA